MQAYGSLLENGSWNVSLCELAFTFTCHTVSKQFMTDKLRQAHVFVVQHWCITWPLRSWLRLIMECILSWTILPRARFEQNLNQSWVCLKADLSQTPPPHLPVAYLYIFFSIDKDLSYLNYHLPLPQHVSAVVTCFATLYTTRIPRRRMRLLRTKV